MAGRRGSESVARAADAPNRDSLLRRSASPRWSAAKCAPNWYSLFRASGIDVNDTMGDGVGRFVAADKAKILDALWSRADRIEGGYPDA